MSSSRSRQPVSAPRTKKVVNGPASEKAVIKAYTAAPSEVQAYFQHLPDLIEAFPWEVSLSYLFHRVELAHSQCLYCGVVKLHKADAGLARTAVNSQHLTRDGFQEFFKAIFGATLGRPLRDRLADAERIRDKVLHGKSATPVEQRKAIVDVIEYASSFNEQVQERARFKPFSNDLRGFKGRARSLDKATSRWLLKGIGFSVS